MQIFPENSSKNIHFVRSIWQNGDKNLFQRAKMSQNADSQKSFRPICVIRASDYKEATCAKQKKCP